MKIPLATVLAALSIFSAHAQTWPDLEKASRALDEGVPEVAIANLQMLLQRDLPENEWPAVAEKLAEAFVRANQPEDALRVLNDARLRDRPATTFWRAQALGSLGRAAEALPLYHQATASNWSFAVEARFGEAEMLRTLNRSDEAIEKFSALFRDPNLGVRAQLRAVELYLDKIDTANAARLLNKSRPTTAVDRKERHILRGRLELASRWPEKAIVAFESVLNRPRGATHSVILAALFGIADAHLQLKTPEKGDDVLEDFIERHPQDADLDLIFAKLDELYRAERKPSRAELERWTRHPDQPRRGLAQWYLARFELRAGHKERAVESFDALQRSAEKSTIMAPALFEFAQLQMQSQQFDRALSVLNEARSLQPARDLLDQINFLAAEIQYRAKHFEAAATSFEQIATSSSSLAAGAKFNAALGWLQLGQSDRFAADYRQVADNTGGEKSAAELRLDAGLVQAANGDKQAADSLQRFVREFPQHERVSEAWVALAELAFHASPPRLEQARKYLSAVSNPTATAEERRDDLAIWIEDASGGNDQTLIAMAKKFLQLHAGSKSAPEIRMKLAEVYYREKDFPNAQTEFELLADQNSSAPWAEKALFFAGESAMSSMGAHSMEQALTLFDRVVHLDGELKWAARNEQAAIERKLDKGSDALVLYDEVLKGNARPAEKREALCGKADIFFELGASDAKNYGRASELYDQLAADREGATHWRKQALFKKGLCLEKETDRDEALATFYEVLEDKQEPNGAGELFWFYKAGFSAGRLLEDESKWKSAAAVYEKLAAAGGARSEEAKQRLDRVRLQHFLWEE